MPYTLENIVLAHKTEKAWLLRMTFEHEADIPEQFTDEVDQWWVPISLIQETDIDDESGESGDGIGEQGSVEVPTWFAKNSNMPYAE